jgi:hypothetical protein
MTRNTLFAPSCGEDRNSASSASDPRVIKSFSSSRYLIEQSGSPTRAARVCFNVAKEVSLRFTEARRREPSNSIFNWIESIFFKDNARENHSVCDFFLLRAQMKLQLKRRDAFALF